jgi:hypothetical protein
MQNLYLQFSLLAVIDIIAAKNVKLVSGQIINKPSNYFLFY